MCHLSQNTNVLSIYRSILNTNYYNKCMATIRLLMLKPQSKQTAVFATAVCLSLSVIWCLRDVQAATTTATVEVNVVSTINLVAQNGIVFGDVSSSSSQGTITIGTDGSRTTTGGATVNTNTIGTPALYEVSGDPNAFYSITLPDSIVLTSAAGNKMTVSNFNSVPASSGQLDVSGRQNMNIGATLGVGSFQPFGAYSGVMAATIEYN